MSTKWKILAVLFCIRVTMAFQFQAVAALSPFLINEYGLSLVDIGLLVGLYLSPGMLIAMPGAAIGQRFGDKLTTVLALLLMLSGGIVVALIPDWTAQVAGRLLAGTGGVVLNVLMSKMVTDWFPGSQLATAMGIFINSWPVGIAASLLILPIIANSFGLAATNWLIIALIGVGIWALMVLYHSPEQATPRADGTSVPKAPLRGAPLVCIVLAAAIWGLYNSALSMIFSFGPLVLVEQGWSAASASSTTSIVLWLVALSVPFGGWLADHLKRRDLVLAVGLLSFAALMIIAPMVEQTKSAFIALGLVAGLAAGPIMSLPASVLVPGNRAWGMGLFFALFYAAIFVSPIAAGHLADIKGSAQIVFPFGAVLLITSAGLLLIFQFVLRQAERAAVVDSRKTI